MTLTADRKSKIISIISGVVSANPDLIYGLRVDDYDYAIGDICNVSHELYQDAMYDENDELIYPDGDGPYAGFYDAGELDGTCAVKVNEENIACAVDNVCDYFGDNLYLIAGQHATSGSDSSEVIISDAEVIYKF